MDIASIRFPVLKMHYCTKEIPVRIFRWFFSKSRYKNDILGADFYGEIPVQ